MSLHRGERHWGAAGWAVPGAMVSTCSSLARRAGNLCGLRTPSAAAAWECCRGLVRTAPAPGRRAMAAGSTRVSPVFMKLSTPSPSVWSGCVPAARSLEAVPSESKGALAGVLEHVAHTDQHLDKQT